MRKARGFDQKMNDLDMRGKEIAYIRRREDDRGRKKWDSTLAQECHFDLKLSGEAFAREGEQNVGMHP